MTNRLNILQGTVCFSKMSQKLIANLKKVLTSLRIGRVTLKFQKCSFPTDNIHHFGHLIKTRRLHIASFSTGKINQLDRLPPKTKLWALSRTTQRHKVLDSSFRIFPEIYNCLAVKYKKI